MPGSRLTVVFTVLCIMLCTASADATKVSTKSNEIKGPDWIINNIIPPAKSITTGQEAFFDIHLTNHTTFLYRRVEVALIPAVSGHRGLFTVKPFHLDNVRPQQGVTTRICVTAAPQASPGAYAFHTVITVAGYRPYTIKQGPKVQVIVEKREATPQSIVPKDVLITVRAKKSSLQSLLDQLRRSHRLDVTEVIELASLGKAVIRLRIPDDRTVDEVMDVLARDPYKLTTQPNYVYRTAGMKADPFIDLQYAFRALHADRLPPGINGKGVAVALIDTGADYQHPDLKGRIAQKKDFVGAGDFCRDLHGTALAGIIAARCGNGIGVCGLAPGVDIIAIRACRPVAEGRMTATTTSLWLSQGLDYAILQKARVINLSLGGPRDPLVAEVIREAFARGIVIVAAAGDRGLANYPPYPAALEEVIAVAAVDVSEKAYAEAIDGDFIDVSAPGVDIMSTAPGEKYNCYSGTSMAAAYVTAAVALLLQKCPGPTPQQVQSLLEKSAADIGAPGRDREFGWGLIDLNKLLYEAKKQ